MNRDSPYNLVNDLLDKAAGNYAGIRDTMIRENEGDTTDTLKSGEGRVASDPSLGRGISGRDAGIVKEIALLKATVESLRLGLREKEDVVTELVRNIEQSKKR